MIVDRIEGDYAVCETEEGIRTIPLSELPGGLREGDVLEKCGESWKTDVFRTRILRENALRRTRTLFRKRRSDKSES